MVQRTYNPVEFGSSSGNAAYVQPGAGYKSPAAARTVGDSSFADTENQKTIQTVLKHVEGFVQSGLKASREEAYLSGQTAAAAGQSKEAIESSFMTKDWAEAGFHDTVGKMKMADEESNLAYDMKTLREGTPEQMQEYLAQRRTRTIPLLEGMSREARITAVAQNLMTDRAAMSAYTTQHMAFQIDQLTAVKQTEFANAKAGLDAALKSGSQPDYDTALARFTDSFIVGSLMSEKRFDVTTRNKFVTQAVDDALGSGNVQVYERMRDAQVPDDITNPGGSTSTVLSRLSFEDQRKLSDKYREARKATVGARTLQLSNEVSAAEAAMKSGKYIDGMAGVAALQQRVLEDDPGNIAGARRIMDTFLTEGAKTPVNKVGIAAQQQAGNWAAVSEMGADDSSAMGYVREEWAKNKVPMEQQTAMTLSMATKGSVAAAKHLGSTLGAVVRGLDLDAKPTVQNAALLSTSLLHVERLQAEGSEAALNNFYAGMPEDQAVRMKRLLAHGATVTPDTAMVAVRAAENLERNTSPADKRLMVAASDKAHKEYVENLDPQGDMARLFSHLPLVGRTAAQHQLSAKTSWWSSMTDAPQITSHAAGVARAAIGEEEESYRFLHPTDTPEIVMAAAEQAVLRRAIPTEDAPLILPKGMVPETFFGIKGQPLNASPESIGKAVSAALPKLDPSGRMVYHVEGRNIVATEYNSKGAPTGSITRVEGSAVRAQLEAVMNGKKERFNQTDGIGIKLQMGKDFGNINGTNAAGMDNDVMLDIRKNLSKHEGFTEGVKRDVGGRLKADGTPVMTTGIGISDTNTYFPKPGPDGKITAEQHIEAFRNATDEAGRNALKLTQALNLKGRNWQILTTELIYQSGIGNVAGKNAVPAYAELLSSKTPAAQLAALEKTPAYTMSGAARQRHLRSLLPPVMSTGSSIN